MRVDPRSTPCILLYCAAASALTVFLIWVTHLTYIDFTNLQRIPETVVLGSLAFIGVLLTTSTHRFISKKQLDQDARKTREQLKHDSDERGRELSHEMRREVYLELASEVSKASSIFGRMTKFDYDTKNIADELAGLGQATAKVAVVANQETAFAAERFLGVYGTQLIDLLPDARAAVQHWRVATFLKKRFDEACENIKSLGDKMQNHMATEGADAKLELMRGELKRQGDVANDIELAWRSAEATASKEDMKFVHVFYTRHASTIAPRVEVQYLLRRELGLECDKSVMLAEAHEIAALAEAAAKRLFDRFPSLIQ